MHQFTYLAGVTTLQFHPEKCTGCRRCTEVCPHGVFRMERKRAVITNRDLCMECGACRRNCGYGAIDVREGVGCAWAIALGKLKGTAPTCG